MTTASAGAQARMQMQIQCNLTASWVDYDLWFHYDGVARNGTTGSDEGVRV